MDPYFTVIIATYNRSKLLKRALESLMNQTEKDWEAVIIDDGSIDDTYALCSLFKKKCTQVKYIKIKHSNEVHSKNMGILFSTGKYITFLDSDDEYHKDHLKSRKQLLNQNASIQFLFGGITLIGNEYVPDRFDCLNKIKLDQCVIGGTFFIDRNVMTSLKGLSQLALGADADLFERAKDAHINMMKTNLPTYIYHHETADSITNKLM
jgi:glycosyltransferase involved in cell wall biosynthesis